MKTALQLLGIVIFGLLGIFILKNIDNGWENSYLSALAISNIVGGLMAFIFIFYLKFIDDWLEG